MCERAIGYAVVGAGIWGETHAIAAMSHPFSRLVAVCDIDESKARALAEKYDADLATTNLEEVLRREDVEAVGIATPDFAHTEPAVAALEAGKHTIVEKPLAMTVEECERILKAAEKSGAKLMVDFHNRFNPPVVVARQSIEKGEVGEVRYIYGRLSDTIYVPTEMIKWSDKTTVLWFLGSHLVDTMRFLTGDEVARVYAKVGEGVLKSRGIDTPDFYVAILEFRGGATAVMEVSWILAPTEPFIVDFKMEVIGSKGTIYMSPPRHCALERYTESEGGILDIGIKTEIQGKPRGFAFDSIWRFIDAVVEDKPVPVPGEEGLKVTKVLCAIEESAKLGRAMDVEV